MRRILAFSLLAMLVAFTSLAVAGDDKDKYHDKDQMMDHEVPWVEKAVAVLHPTEGNEVSGTVWFEKQGDEVRVRAELTGLKPGKHGFHIHQFGDCSASDGTSAGGHFNPFDKPHAGPDADKRHMGDLGNIEVDGKGNASYNRVDSHLKLNGPIGIVGRSVIVHAGEDDLSSQPTGDAGGRVACGVIGVAQDGLTMKPMHEVREMMMGMKKDHDKKMHKMKDDPDPKMKQSSKGQDKDN